MAPAPFPCRTPTPCVQSAFECLGELLDSCYDRMDAAACIYHLESGLQVLLTACMCLLDVPAGAAR